MTNNLDQIIENAILETGHQFQNQDSKEDVDFVKELIEGVEGEKEKIVKRVVPLVYGERETLTIKEIITKIALPIHKSKKMSITTKFETFREKTEIEKVTESKQLIGNFKHVDSKQKQTIKEFIQFMCDKNYNFDIPIKEDYSNNTKQNYPHTLVKISPLEYLIKNNILLSLLDPGALVGVKPSEKTKEILFKTLTDNNLELIEKYYLDYDGETQTEHNPNYEILIEYINLMQENYPNKEESEECLKIELENLTRDNIKYGHLVPFLERLANIKSLSKILKNEPKYKGFYDLLDFMLDKRIFVSEYEKEITRIQATENFKPQVEIILKQVIKEHSEYQKKEIRKSKRIRNEEIREMEIVSYNSIETLEELKKLKSLNIEGYLPIAKIGEGGIRKVYKVIHKQRDHILALKLDKPLEEITNERAKEVIKQHEQNELAKRERLALMDLTHENLARMYDFGEYKGCRYVVEAYVEGMTLEELVKGSSSYRTFHYYKPVMEMATLILCPLIKAVIYLGEKKYIHRDIKPSNIIISKGGHTLKLTDLQNAIKREGYYGMEWEETSFYTGKSYGTLKTAAPEVIFENKSTHASDIYAVGASMYYLLTGGKYPEQTPIEKIKEEKDNSKRYEGFIKKELFELAKQFNNCNLSNYDFILENEKWEEGLVRNIFFIVDKMIAEDSCIRRINNDEDKKALSIIYGWYEGFINA